MIEHGLCSASELRQALWLLRPTIKSFDVALELCCASGLVSLDLIAEAASVEKPYWDSLQSPGIDGLTPEQSRHVVDQLSTTWLSNPFGERIAFHLFRDYHSLFTPGESLRLISSLWPQISFWGHWADWFEILEMIHSEPGLPSDMRLLLLYYRAICARWLGRFESAIKLVDDALHISLLEDEPYLRAKLYLELGRTHRLKGHLLSAQSTVRYAQGLCSQTENARDRDLCLLEIAQIAVENGDPNGTFTHLQSLPSSPQLVALTCEAYMLRGQYEVAVEMLIQLSAMGFGTRSNEGRANALLAMAYKEMGRLSMALEAILISLEILSDTDDRVGHARCLSYRGQLYLLLGNFTLAVDDLETALSSQQAMQDIVGLRATLPALLETHTVLAEQALSARQIHQARHHAERLRSVNSLLNQAGSLL